MRASGCTPTAYRDPELLRHRKDAPSLRTENHSAHTRNKPQRTQTPPVRCTMPITFNLAGVTHGALNGPLDDPITEEVFDRLRGGSACLVPDEHDADAILVCLVVGQMTEAGPNDAELTFAVHGGYVPAALLATAHADNWCDRDWTIADIGTWTPPGQNRTVPYCRLTCEDAPAQQQ